MKNHLACGLLLVVCLAWFARPAAGVTLSQHVYSLLYTREGHVYAGTASGDDPWNSVGVVYKSVDGGATWNPTADLGGLNVVGNIEGLIQTTGGGIDGDIFISTAWNSRLYKSANGGDSWTFLTNVVGGSADCILQAENGDLYVTTGSGSAAYIYCSTNGGATWPEVASTTNGLPGMVVMEQIIQTTNGTFFCTGQPGHVWRSTDGVHWDKVGTNTVHFGGSYKNYSLLEAADGSIYVTTRQPAGVYRSTDHGSTWTQMANSTELGGGVTRCDIIMQTRCGLLFVGTSTARVYKSRDGDNWELAMAFSDTTRVNDIVEGPLCTLFIGSSYPGNVYLYRVDTNAPVLPSLPVGGDLGFNPDPLPSCVDDLMATDNLDGEVPVACSAGLITGDDFGKTQVFTYVAADCCENAATGTVTYTWKVDLTPPELPELPAGGDLGLNPVPLPSCVDDLVATDNYDGEVPVVCSAGAVTGDDCDKGQVFTYTATDSAGNAASGTVTYTWQVDVTPPELPSLPVGGDLGVNPDPLPSCVDDLIATDNCDGEVPVICSAGEVTGDNGHKSQVFTYTATDTAGNTVSNTVTYTWTEGWIQITSEKQGEDQILRIQSVDNLPGGLAQYLDACTNLLAQDWGCLQTNEATLPWPVTNLWEFDLLPEPVLRFFRIRQ